MDLRQFRALQAVRNTGSIARAAKQLGWSTPTVDHHLLGLEREVQGAVVTRGSRGTSLTAVGVMLVERADEILVQIDRAVIDAQEFTNFTPPKLKIGLFPTAAARLLPTIAQDLARVGIEVEARVEEAISLTELLTQRELDAALTYTVPTRPIPVATGIMVDHLHTDPLLFAMPASHKFARKQHVTIADITTLKNENWIMGATPNDPLDLELESVIAEHDGLLDVAIHTDDLTVAMGMVAAGLAVALIPELAVNHPPQGMVLRPLTDAQLQRELYLVTTDAVRGSLQHLQNAVTHAIQTQLQ